MNWPFLFDLQVSYTVPIMLLFIAKAFHVTVMKAPLSGIVVYFRILAVGNKVVWCISFAIVM